MIAILNEENPDEDTILAQNQIRDGIRAIMLHPLTPERVLTRLSACMFLLILSLFSIAASTAFGKVQCPLQDLAVMEVCHTRRMEFIKNGTLQAGRRLRGGIRSDTLTVDMCAQIVFDFRDIDMKATGEMPDTQIARPFTLVANNDLIDFVFEWCAKNDRDDFPITLTGVRDECKLFFPIMQCDVQLCVQYLRIGMTMIPTSQ